MTQAIQWCINHNTLEEFLKSNSSEVMNMLMEEWDLDTALKVEWEEGREKGREEGREEERRNTLSVQQMYAEARRQFEEARRENERLRAQLGR
jgi:predicted transposase YdaD